jgi:hypothetical protein
MKSVSFLVSVLLATALSTQASAHSKKDPLAREAAMATIIESVDAGTAASIQTRAELIKRQHASLRELHQSDTADRGSIRTARQALRDSRREMGREIRRVLDEQPELRAQLKSQRQTLRQQRRLSKFVIANDDAFNLLTNAAPADLQQSLSDNRELLATARSAIRDARDSGASKTQVKSLVRHSRELFQSHRASVGRILTDNAAVQTQLLAMADEAGFKHRARKH